MATLTSLLEFETRGHFNIFTRIRNPRSSCFHGI